MFSSPLQWTCIIVKFWWHILVHIQMLSFAHLTNIHEVTSLCHVPKKHNEWNIALVFTQVNSKLMKHIFEISHWVTPKHGILVCSQVQQKQCLTFYIPLLWQIGWAFRVLIQHKSTQSNSIISQEVKAGRNQLDIILFNFFISTNRKLKYQEVGRFACCCCC